MMGQSGNASGSKRGTASQGQLAVPVCWVTHCEHHIVQNSTLPTSDDNVVLFPAAAVASSGNLQLPPAAPMLPVGKAFFEVVRQQWRQPTEHQVAVASQDDMMDIEDIMDAVSSTPGDLLSPPVPLPLMVEVLIELWEDEGLYS
jgi:hypothetical protein